MIPKNLVYSPIGNSSDMLQTICKLQNVITQRLELSKSDEGMKTLDDQNLSFEKDLTDHTLN